MTTGISPWTFPTITDEGLALAPEEIEALAGLGVVHLPGAAS